MILLSEIGGNFIQTTGEFKLVVADRARSHGIAPFSQQTSSMV